MFDPVRTDWKFISKPYAFAFCGFKFGLDGRTDDDAGQNLEYA